MSPAAGYRIEYDPRALQELAKLDKPVRRRIVRAVNELGTEPRPPGCRALTGYPGLWRSRVGDHRVVYVMDDTELVVLVLRVAHRGTVYRRL